MTYYAYLDTQLPYNSIIIIIIIQPENYDVIIAGTLSSKLLDCKIKNVVKLVPSTLSY